MVHAHCPPFSFSDKDDGTDRNRLAQVVITKALPYTFEAFGYGAWFFFACWMLITTVWAFVFLPETKGKTLEDFDVIL